MTFIYIGTALMLIGYGGRLALHVRDIVRERRARRDRTPQLPAARIKS